MFLWFNKNTPGGGDVLIQKTPVLTVYRSYGEGNGEQGLGRAQQVCFFKGSPSRTLMCVSDNTTN